MSSLTEVEVDGLAASLIIHAAGDFTRHADKEREFTYHDRVRVADRMRALAASGRAKR